VGYTPPTLQLPKSYQAYSDKYFSLIAGWSSPVARQAHNLKVVSSNLAPATNISQLNQVFIDFTLWWIRASQKLVST
jgi:hypothetical protein